MENNLEIIQEQEIVSKIYFIRGNKVLLVLYEVETNALNQAVKRNMERFPGEFMFQLTEKEFKNLKSQIVTSSWGGTRKLPYAFTKPSNNILLPPEKSKQIGFIKK